MSSLKRFLKILSESYRFVLSHFASYLGSYLAFVLIGWLSSIPWSALGYESNSTSETLVALLVGILSLIVIVNVILIEKARSKLREKEQLVYAVPTYLIYTLYSTITILIGPGIAFFVLSLFPLHHYATLALAAIPGIAVAIFVGMVPLASVLIDNDSINYFRVSYRMARQNPVLIFCFGVSSFLIEAPSFAFDFIPQWQAKLVFNGLYAFFDAVVMIVLTVASVRIFYHLKHQLNDPSQ